MIRTDSPGVHAWGATFRLALPCLALLAAAMLLAGCRAIEAVETVATAPPVTATTSSAATDAAAHPTYQSAGTLQTPVSPPDRATTAPPKRSATGDLIPRVHLTELPIEATTTIDLIRAGGPFPFERDGAVFRNFEQRLPAAGEGAYREYTVITPGSDDRGARRIVTNVDQTEFYYTDDHYESFREILIPERRRERVWRFR